MTNQSHKSMTSWQSACSLRLVEFKLFINTVSKNPAVDYAEVKLLKDLGMGSPNVYSFWTWGPQNWGCPYSHDTGVRVNPVSQ